VPTPLEVKVERVASPETVPPAPLEVGNKSRLWSVVDAAKGRWAGVSMERRFTFVTVAVVMLAMILLGHWVDRRVRAGWTQIMAEIAASYIEAVISPHIAGLEPDAQRLTPAMEASLRAVIREGALASKVRDLKIWSTSGELIFSTAGPPRGEKLRPLQLARLLAGETIAPGHNHAGVGERDVIEIYTPIYDRNRSRVTLIGEFYKRNDLVGDEVNQLKYALWFLIANVGCVIGAALYALIRRASRVIARQQAEHEANVERASALAKRNSALRRAADRARISAALTNEEYLSRIGADLHDGPIQMLSLMMLRLPPRSSNPAIEEIRHTFQPLIEQTLGELRNLSAGLVLPEIRELSPLATLEAAVTSHERYTGTQVRRLFRDLPTEMPEAIRVCAFRVIQEALMNAYKHAGGSGQSVTALFDRGNLTLAIEDAGGKSQAGEGGGLGLRGMRMRIHALRGTLAVAKSQAGGTRIEVLLPVRARSLVAPIDPDEHPEPEA
jgi:signal transduction histidine kinase